MIANLGPWSWVILGVVLMGLELAIPGGFLLWLGLASITTGLLIWTFGLAWQPAMLVFVVLAVALAYLGRWLSRPAAGEDDARVPNLNRPAQSLVGRVFKLEQAIVDGAGRIRIADTSWRVSGPDLPEGTAVRVVGIEGATLLIEPA